MGSDGLASPSFGPHGPSFALPPPLEKDISPPKAPVAIILSGRNIYTNSPKEIRQRSWDSQVKSSHS